MDPVVTRGTFPQAPNNDWSLLSAARCELPPLGTCLRVLADIYSVRNGQSRTIHPGIQFVGPEEKLRLYAPAAVFDIDETILKGSCDLLHDGPRGRFAEALMWMLLKKGIQFRLEDWPKYRKLTGKTESLVCEEICQMAEKDYGVKISPKDYQEEAVQVVLRDKEKYFSRLKLVPGLTELFEALHRTGCPIATCSCGERRVMAAAMEYFGVQPHLKTMEGSAEKRLRGEMFTAKSIVKAMRFLRRAAQSSVVFGDSISDIGAAARAGAAMAVIRLPRDDEASRKKLLAEYASFRATYPRAAARLRIVVLSDWKQVEAMPAWQMADKRLVYEHHPERVFVPVTGPGASANQPVPARPLLQVSVIDKTGGEAKAA